MAHERREWENDSAIMAEMHKESAPAANAPGPLAEKASESSTLRGHEDDANAEKKTETEGGESATRHSEATTS